MEEGRKIKCHQYWPSTGSMEYGPFVVTLLEQIELTDYTIRTFTVSEGNSSLCQCIIFYMFYSGGGGKTKIRARGGLPRVIFRSLRIRLGFSLSH